MNIGNFKVSIDEDILIITSRKESATLDIAREMKELMENTTGKTYNYCTFNNVIGYFSGYDFKENHSIYCGTMSEKTSIEQIKEYKKK